MKGPNFAPRELAGTFSGASGQYLCYMEWTVITVFFNTEIRAAEVIVFGVLHLNQSGCLLLPRWSIDPWGQ